MTCVQRAHKAGPIGERLVVQGQHSRLPIVGQIGRTGHKLGQSGVQPESGPVEAGRLIGGVLVTTGARTQAGGGDGGFQVAPRLTWPHSLRYLLTGSLSIV